MKTAKNRFIWRILMVPMFKKITNPTNLQHRSPKFSPSGDKIVYLSEDQEGIQSLRTITLNKSKDRELTDEELHVKDAIFFT